MTISGSEPAARWSQVQCAFAARTRFAYELAALSIESLLYANRCEEKYAMELLQKIKRKAEESAQSLVIQKSNNQNNSIRPTPCDSWSC